MTSKEEGRIDEKFNAILIQITSTREIFDTHLQHLSRIVNELKTRQKEDVDLIHNRLRDYDRRINEVDRRITIEMELISKELNKLDQKFSISSIWKTIVIMMGTIGITYLFTEFIRTALTK